MATKTVKKTFSSCWLSTCDTVLLCLFDPAKTAAHVGYIIATIPDDPVTTPAVGCVSGGCAYEFCYDANLLADPTSALVPCDVKSVERLSCVIDYIETFIASPVSTDANNVIESGSDDKAYLSCADIAACANSFTEVSAMAGIGEGTTCLGDFAANTPKLIDFNSIGYDPHAMITPGAAWKVTVPADGRYHFDVSVRSTNAVWGHQGGGNFVGWSLQYAVNGGSIIPIANTDASDIDNAVAQQALVAGRGFILDLAAGDYVKFYAEHTDTDLGVAHGIVQDSLSSMHVFRIGNVVLP